MFVMECGMGEERVGSIDDAFNRNPADSVFC